MKGTMYGSCARTSTSRAWWICIWTASSSWTTHQPDLPAQEINEGFAAIRGGQVARGVIVFS